MFISSNDILYYYYFFNYFNLSPRLRLVFAGSVDKPHYVSHIARYKDIETVAQQIIELEDNLFTVDIKTGFHHIKIHSLYCLQEPFNNINYKSHWQYIY